MKKVLILDSFCDLCMGGVAQFLVNALSNMDLSDYDVDLLTPGRAASPIRKEEFERLGNNWIVLNVNIDNNASKVRKVIEHIQFARRMEKVFRQKQYDIVHVNGGSLLYHVIVLSLAKRYHVPHRISHGHNASPHKPNFASRRLQKAIVRSATDLCACANQAADFYFGEAAGQATIVPNGINIRRFAFDPSEREKCREKYGIPKDAYVVGHIGRFDMQKNHQFLIDIFYEISKRCPEALLLSAGDGDLKTGIQQKVKDLGLGDRVIFAGTTSETEKLYCAMDVFAFPSIHEGLPIVIIEAQTSGLTCYVSEAVPHEEDVEGKLRFLPLGSAELWAQRILEHRDENIDRASAWEAVAKAGYDMSAVAKRVQDLYDRM